MNHNCLESFVISASLVGATYELVLIESNGNATFNYDIKNLTIIKPQKLFNFHRFFNIGIKAAINDYLILSNNDVIFDLDFVKEAQEGIKKLNLLSYSPYDIKSNKLSKSEVERHDFVKGYDIQKHIAGWCIIVKKTIFDTIGSLDERFPFFYADSDYALILQKYNIQHALLTKCKAVHLESMSKTGKPKIYYDYKNHKGIPKYVIEENRYWILNSERMINGVIQFHRKWGSRRLLKLKLIIADKLQKWGLGKLNKIILFHR